MARDSLKVGKIISKIGRAAGVVVDPESRKSATAHDLRRTFGTRGAKRVMPATLKELMRHSSIDTTLTCYVGQSAKRTSAELWATLGNTLGNTHPFSGQKKEPLGGVTPSGSRISGIGTTGFEPATS